MDQILLNQRTVNSRKQIKKVHKKSTRRYLKGKSISRTKIGKLVELLTPGTKGEMTKTLPVEASLEKLMELLEQNSLTGMSGNGFKVKTKLASIVGTQHEKMLIINGVECEPGLIHDEWLLNNHWNEVAMGIQLLRRMIPFKRCVLACKLLKAEKGKKKDEPGFEVCGVPANFPMGEERLLVKQVLGKTLKNDEYPTDAGILVMNVQTVYQIYCLLTNQYSGGRYITIADLESGEAKVEYVKRGENIKDKIKICFPGNTSEQCFAGSGIMSAHSISEDECFSDQISFAALGQPAQISDTALCKGCGKCNKKCPSGVNIKKIVKLKEADSHADISDLGIENCIHCGSCTFFCKAGKNIAEYLSA